MPRQVGEAACRHDAGTPVSCRVEVDAKSRAGRPRNLLQCPRRWAHTAALQPSDHRLGRCHASANSACVRRALVRASSQIRANRARMSAGSARSSPSTTSLRVSILARTGQEPADPHSRRAAPRSSPDAIDAAVLCIARRCPATRPAWSGTRCPVSTAERKQTDRRSN